jgi:hypothetical protein
LHYRNCQTLTVSPPPGHNSNGIVWIWQKRLDNSLVTSLTTSLDAEGNEVRCVLDEVSVRREELSLRKQGVGLGIERGVVQGDPDEILDRMRPTALLLFALREVVEENLSSSRESRSAIALQKCGRVEPGRTLPLRQQTDTPL